LLTTGTLLAWLGLSATSCCWGLLVGLLFVWGVLSQAKEKLLLPPGAWWTLTEVVP
jgi:hypothetical protein